MKAHDAGLKGTMTETLDGATFIVDELKSGQSVTIGGKGYTVGSLKADIDKKFDAVVLADLAELKKKIKDTSTVEFADGTKLVGMGADANTDGISDVNSSIITADKAYNLMELYCR